MALLTTDTLFILVIIASLVLVFKPRRRYRLPPGPKGFPIIGNVLQVPQGHGWVQYRDWSLECGQYV